MVSSADLIIGFNLKFDLHWLRRYGITLSSHTRVWDCQLFEFIRGHQRAPFPSLNDAGIYYGAGIKDETVKTEYWDRGIDTDKIPQEVLHKYLFRDLDLTYKVYVSQQTVLRDYSQARQNLIKLHMQDLLVLEEMEFNGLKISTVGLDIAGKKASEELKKVEDSLSRWTNGFRHFNFDSNDHVSSLLYGGRIVVDVGIPYIHTYKSGPKAGLSETRNKWKLEEITLPQLVEPLEGSELEKKGYWSTDEKWLGKLKHKRTVKELCSLLMHRSTLEKLIGTYFVGLPKLIQTMDWAPGFLHGQLNQTVVVTGRLSSSKPNMQNFDKEVNRYLESRF